MTGKRLITNIALLISVLFLPWWISVGMSLIGLFIFNRFYEAIVFMFAIDLLYGAPGNNYWSFQFLLTSIAVLVLTLIGAIKRRFRI